MRICTSIVKSDGVDDNGCFQPRTEIEIMGPTSNPFHANSTTACGGFNPRRLESCVTFSHGNAADPLNAETNKSNHKNLQQWKCSFSSLRSVPKFLPSHSLL